MHELLISLALISPFTNQVLFETDRNHLLHENLTGVTQK